MKHSLNTPRFPLLLTTLAVGIALLTLLSGVSVYVYSSIVEFVHAFSQNSTQQQQELAHIHTVFYTSLGILILVILVILYAAYALLRIKNRTIKKNIQLFDKLKAAKKETVVVKAVIDNASSGIGIINSKGYFLKVNEAYSKLLGYSQEELLGLSCLDLTRAKDKNFAKAIIDTAHKRGYVHNIDKVCITKSGNLVHLDFSIQRLPDNETFVVVVNSMQERIALKSAFQKLQYYFNNSAVGFAVIDQEGKISDVNPFMAELFGYQKEELIGHDVTVLHATFESSTLWLKSVQTLKAQSIDSSIKSELKHKSGKSIYVEVSCVPLKLDDKSQDGSIICTFVDVTRIVQSNKLIEELNAQMQSSIDFMHTLIDVIPLPVFVQDEYNTYMQTNKAFRKLFDLKDNEIVGRSFEDIHDNEETINAIAKLEQNTKTHMRYTLKLRVAFSNKEEFIAEFHTAAIMRNGIFKGMTGVIVDVTQHEEQERFLQRQVESVLHERMIEQQQHEEERMRSAKFSAIGQLSAGITHEINTPLTYIKGNLELMQYDIEDISDETLKNQMKQDMDKVQDGLVRISNIIESMREMSGKDNEKKEYVNIYNSFVTALIMLHNRSKHIAPILINGTLFTLDIAKTKDSYIAFVQKQRMEQVWVILVNNALDELAQKGEYEERKIDITIKEQDKYVIVEVHDNAGGIKQELLPVLFEPFTSTKEHSGMGVGLSIAKKIVTEQEGTIRADNAQDGALFTIQLPKVAHEECKDEIENLEGSFRR